MKTYFCDRFVIPLPHGHRFPIEKYRLLRERVQACTLGRFELCEAPAIDFDALSCAHDADYLGRVLAGRMSRKEQQLLGFPWSSALVERSRRSVGATLAAARTALDAGVAVSLAGGTHHADHAAGAGFCVFNDVAVAALSLVRAQHIQRALIIDCDVHQGEGTARILAREPDIFTLSAHSARNYPHDKAISDIDVALPDGTADDAYLRALQTAVERGFERAHPDLVIYIAGADAYQGDRLGRLALTKAGLIARDRLVLDYAERHHASIAVVMGGGYALELSDIVDVHYNTACAAAAAYSRRARSATPPGLSPSTT